MLTGDVSIQYQVYRDLLGKERKDLQKRIATEGWGKRFLSKRKSHGHWGRGFYQPKWISSPYTLLDLKNLRIDPVAPQILETIHKIVQEEKSADGGVNPGKTIQNSDVCINGMFMNYACYFGLDESLLRSIVDFILSQTMSDGGFNCRLNRIGAVHSSLHTTLSILEGIHEYDRNGYTYRLRELRDAEKSSREFILMHQLYISDRTGEIIHPSFLRMPYPSRWKYDILHALDYFQSSRVKWDERMRPAINFLLSKRSANLTWRLNAGHSGQTHFEMESAGKPSRWNTLRAMRVLKWYDHRSR